ncbi:DUF397 domain-containing protein [Dactylosporangium sp. NPDC048998]|uniref:DUF397 domain-containing protein n=1 Tax=Dactylosporangium sp. NPDC048998 TaxID=3363976 RepID=UPI003717795A
MQEPVTLPGWRRSTYCGTQSCVEVADLTAENILVRDAKNPDGSVLSFDRETWGSFVAGIKDGAFDLQ